MDIKNEFVVSEWVTQVSETIVSLAKADNLPSLLDEFAAQARAAGVKLGKNFKCPVRRAFKDQIVGLCEKAKLAPRTAENYLTAFVHCVHTGEKFSRSHSKGSAAKGSKGKKASPEFAALVAKAFSHKGFAAWAEAMQEKYDNDEGTLEALTRDYLVSEGYEITE